MKLNWGHGLVIAMGTGMTLILILVFFTSRERIDLVTEDYYPKELKYEEQLDKIRNYQRLPEKLVIEANGLLSFRFPRVVDQPDSINGTIHVYRPSDRKMDLNIPIHLNGEFTQGIPLSALKKGKYDLIIEWQAGGIEYLVKEPFSLSK